MSKLFTSIASVVIAAKSLPVNTGLTVQFDWDAVPGEERDDISRDGGMLPVLIFRLGGSVSFIVWEYGVYSQEDAGWRVVSHIEKINMRF